MTDKPSEAAIRELLEMLEAANMPDGLTIFDHTPEEIGAHVMDNHEAIVLALRKGLSHAGRLADRMGAEFVDREMTGALPLREGMSS